MATKSPKLGTPVSVSPIVLTDESPDDYVGTRYVPVAAPPAQAQEPSGAMRRIVGDGLVTAVKGAIGVPEAAVGLADIATGGRVGKVLENEGGAIGFRPKQAREYLDTLYSPEQQAAFREVQSAADPNAPLAERIIDTGAAALRNPSTIAHAIGESLPSMGAGGVLARGVTAVAPRVAGWAAAGIGEGMVAAGAGAERIRQETKDGLLTPEQALIAAGSGAATAGIGMVAARAAKAMGIGDVDVLLAGGKAVPGDVQKGFTRRVLEGAFTEGILEELPQSVQEQVAQNYALGKPLDEGVDIAAVMGVLSGGAMGFGVNAMPRPKVPEVGPLSRGANLAGSQQPVVPPAAPAAPVAPTAPAAPVAAPVAAPTELPPLDDQAAIARMERENQRLQADAAGRSRAAEDSGANLGVVSGAASGWKSGTEAWAAPAAPAERDELYDQAEAIVRASGRASISEVQRHLRIGYNRAARLLEQMEQAGVVGPMGESGQRPLTGKAQEPAATEQAAPTAAPAPELEDIPFADQDDILNPQGDPFKTAFAARRRQASLPEPDAYQVTQVQGGFALRRKAMQEAAANAGQRTDGASGAVAQAGAGAGVEPARGDGAVPADVVGGVGDAAGEADTGSESAAAVADAQPKRADALRAGADRPGAVVGSEPINQRPANAAATGAADVLARLPKPAGNVATDPIAGEAIDGEWTAFKPESGTKGVPRADMPQIKAGDRSALVQFLRARGVDYTEDTVPATSLKPTQAEFSPGKVQGARDFAGDNRAILVSSDGHVLDGHHQWMAKRQDGGDVRVIRLGAPIDQLLAQAREFPSATTAGGATEASTQAAASPKDAASAPAPAPAAEDTPEARWTRAPEAERLAILSRAGWSVNPPSMSTQKVLRTPWGSMTQSQRDRITAAMDGGPAAQPEAPKETALERIKRLKAERAPKVEESDQDRSHREWRENYDRVVNTADLSSVSTKDLDRAAGYGANMVAAEKRKGWDGGRVNADLVRSAEVDMAAIDAELKKRRATSASKPAAKDKSPEQQRDDAKPANKHPLESAGWSAEVGGPNNTIWTKRANGQRYTAILTPASGNKTDSMEVTVLVDGVDTQIASFTFNDQAVAAKLAERAISDDADEHGNVAATQGDQPKASANTVFTEEAAEKARAILKRKLGQLSSGIDPEILQAGITLAGYHIERGARTFAAYAKAMIGDLGEGVRPYLKSWYMGVKYDPRAAAFQDGMSTAAEVEAADVAGQDAAEDAGQADDGAKPSLDGPEGRRAIAQSIADHFIGGNSFASIVEARKFVGDLVGKRIDPATNDAKLTDETVELAVVLAGREIVRAARRQGRSDSVIYDRLVSLYKAQPNLSVRSSTSVREQAYSTPVPLAFLASRLARVTPDSRVGEPTAGNGMLMIEVAPENATVNELNADRAANLGALGFSPMTNNATTTALAPAKSLDVEIMNPPFGATKGDDRQTVTFSVLPGYSTYEVDHAIAFKALDALKDDGTAVLILGGVDESDPDRIRDGYRGKTKREFYYHLYQNYGVTDHFTVDGDLYGRQGAGYPVDVVVIRGRGKATRVLPAADLPQRFDSWESLKEKLNGESAVVPAGRELGAGVGDGAPRGVDQGGMVGSPVGQGDVDGAQGARPGAGRDSGRPSARDTAAGQPGADGRGGRAAQPGADDGDDARRGGRGKPIPGEGGGREPRGTAGDAGNEPDGLAGLGKLDGERVQSGLSDRRGLEQETASQVAYSPRSGVSSVGTLVPVNMRDAIQASLDRVQDEVGNLDSYVAEALGFEQSQLGEYFSAEQVDALALAVYNAEQNKGFIIGDQTGIGKGRVVAGMIRYALNRGKTPIFVTEKPNLYADMVRDLDDIGMSDALGLESGAPAILITNGDGGVPYTLQRKVGGEIVEHKFDLKPPARDKKLSQELAGMVASNSMGRFKVVFTTYNQLQTVRGKITDRMQFVQHFGDGGYLIFDESHNAGGNDAGQARTKQQRSQAAAGETLVTGRAAFVRNLVRKSGGSFFSSATYAKRPDVMDLYSSTNMMLAVNRPADLAPAIKSGGVPMQQIVATMLTEDGQYIRRERTFAGVSYETRPMKVDRQTAENMATAMRRILEFSRAKEAAVKALQKDADREAATLRIEGEKTQVQGASFGSIMHNLIDQMLLSLKSKDSVAFAIERLKAGEKVVLTVSNTMGSFLDEYSREMGIRTGEPVALSFKDLYMRYLEKQRMVTIRRPSGPPESYRLTDEDLGPQTAAMYRDIEGFLANAGFGDAPISPIDYMHDELRKAGFKTDEITGRTITLNYSGGIPKLASRQANIKQRLAAISGFNGGAIDALILNQSGSTGLSLHASAKVKDQRMRRMIVVQAEKNIDTHMQMLGRVHRTGQVIVPAYTQATAEIPAETRPAAVLMKKMGSLSANTTASRKSAVTAEGVVDFMNDYGGQVVHEYLMDNPEIHQAIGGKKVLDLLEDPSEATEDDIRKFTGYIPILPIEQQEQVYADLIDRYNELIAREDAMGTNKLEARALDLGARTVSSETLASRKDGNSRFAAPAVMERVDVKRTVKPLSGQEVAQAIADSLAGKSRQEHSRGLLTEAEGAAEAYRRTRVAALAASGADPARIARENDTINLQLGQVRAILLGYPIGTPVAITDKNGGLSYGVVTAITDGKKTKNPVAGSSWKLVLALANGDARTITLHFGQVGTAVNLRAEPGEVLTFRVGEDGNVMTDDFERVSIMSLFDRGANVRRERRWMVTGNILAGYAKHPGQIVNYTKDDGTIGQGVLMPRTFDFNKVKNSAPAEFATVDQVRQFFAEAKGSAIIGTSDGALRITLLGNGGMDFVTSSSKREGGTYFLDTGLTRAIGQDFYKSSQTMRARVSYEDDAYAGVRYLMEQREDVRLVALTNIPVARKVLGIGEAADGDATRAAMSRGAAAQAVRDMRAGMPTESVRALVREIARSWPNAPEVVVVPTITDEAVPEDIREEARRAVESADAGAPNGFFDTLDGKVYLIADKLPDEASVVRVLMHETLGHYGMRAVFGKDFGAMLDRMSMLNAGKVRAAARQLGFDFDKPSERRLAAEEVLAYMAQETPEIGWVQRAVAAIRTWAREHIPRFRELALSDAEIIRDFILPARRFVTGRGPGGGGRRGNVASRAMFSRAPLGQALGEAANNIRDVRLPAGYLAGDFINQNAGKLHWWHKTVGTMFHLAERSPAFKRVYDGVQSFLNDVSYYATEAADLAPRILPKLDKFADVWKSPLSAADTKAISRPIFEGTLTWGRDSNGVARPIDDIEADMLAEIARQPLREGATSDERLVAELNGKAQLLLREGKVTPEVMRMWQGQPLERYQAIIEGKFERELLAPGVVFTPAELKEHFGLTDDQVGLYQEFRAATDRSLSDLTITGMLRLAGKDGDAVRDLVLSSGDVGQAGDLLAEKLRELGEVDPERADYLNDLSNQVVDKAGRARDLMGRGYAPLSRFGTYTLDVVSPEGQRLYFGLFESRSERAKMARALAAEHPGASIEQGTLSQEAFKLFAGISPETAELFGEMLGLDAQGDEAKNQAFQEYLKKARSNRDAVKRLIKRKGIAGFSEDAGRVLAGFVYSNARQSAASLHMGEIDRAVEDIPRSQGELKDEAVKLREYVKNPQEEAATFRAILFAQYLGGSIASAMVNATQPIAVTLPYLSQWGGPKKSAIRMRAAMRDALRDTTGDAGLDAALKRAEEDGIVAPQEVHSLMAQAMGKAQLRSGDGTRLGDAAAAANNTLSRVSLAWGKVFGVAELFNRRTTFIAAYRTAAEEGMANPAKFAEKAVAETQFTYNKGNKPRWARGLAGSVLFTFKQYSVNYVELLHRMANAGDPGSPERKAGRQAALLALAVLFLMAGADGLPFAEDAQDVVDAALQRMGYNISSKQKVRELLASAITKPGADFVMNGITGLPGAPIDVSGRLGMGNLLPGTGLLLKKADHTRDLMELAGPGGDFAKRAFTAAGELASGNVATAARTISPSAARNAAQGIDMLATGMYRDERGRKVIDTGVGDALAKAIGFQPADVKDVQDASREVQRMKAQHQLAQAEFREKMARAIFDGDAELQAEARADLASWNAKNPTMRLSSSMPAVLARVREMRKTKAQRVADTAPKAIRELARKQMAEGV